MRFIFILALALSSNSYADEFCNWGYAGPKVYTCNGQKYCYGTAACSSGIYRGVFCKERFCDQGKDCADDNSKETIDCYDKLIAKEDPKEEPESEFCSWGYNGSQTIRCNGKEYCYGTAACASGIYSNVFCRIENCQQGKSCQDDNNPDTISCYDQTVGKRKSPQDSWPRTDRPSGAVK
jgi:hypothetical protein